MNSILRRARLRAGLSQQEAATKLGVSQPYYSQLENGTRVLPEKIGRLAMRRLSACACVLPLPRLGSPRGMMSADDLAGALGRLGYDGFAQFRKSGKTIHPALVVAEALSNDDLDVRVVEGLPWVLANFADLDWTWLLAECRLLNAQNRLGYLVDIARQIADEKNKPSLEAALVELEKSRLAVEGTLCRESMTIAERRWVSQHRPPAAAHWNLLTTMTAEQLGYAA